MVKKIIIFIFLSIILIGVSIGEQLFIDNTINTMLKHIDSFETTIIENENNLNSQNVLAKFYKIENYWENRESTMAFFVDHKNISNIGQGLVRLIAALEENDYTLSKTEIYLLREVAFVFKKMSTFNVHNVF